LGTEILIQQQFYTGFGQNDVPTNTDWKNALNLYLPQLIKYNLGYYINGNFITVKNLTLSPKNLGELFKLNVGIDMEINCDNG
jgi:hypothetical protein